jgi:GNAT superfamily N-acetyltransferase
MPENLRPTRDLVADWRPGDAEKLAQLWNEMGPAWPGQFGGKRVTTEEAEREFRERAKLAAFVAEANGKVVAYCDLLEGWDKPHNCYVGFLTAHPDYHGKGFGKAVLLACVEKAYQLGYARVDLGTWAGNTKAVPLYKKAGFMWVPETEHYHGVHMENFTPFARQHPIGREFFAHHDWYATLKRGYDLKEDLFKRGKVKMFPYEWRAPDGRFLKMTFDPQSWGLLAIETNEFRAACFLPDEKLVCGLPHAVRWEIVNRTGKPLHARLRASGERGIAINCARTLIVKDRAALDAQFVVDPKIPEKKKPPRVPIITTRLRLGAREIEFKAGFQAQQPLSVGIEWPTPSLVPGRPEKVFFHVRSRLSAKADAQVRLQPPAGVSVEPSSAKVSLRPKGVARFPVAITSSRRGKVQITCTTRARTAARTVAPKPDKPVLLAAGPLECGGFVDRHHVALQSPGLAVWIGREGGYVNVSRRAKIERDGVGIWTPSVGPPFHWDEFFKERCKARIERSAGKVTAVLETESSRRPGVWLIRRITLGSDPVLQVADTIENRSSSAEVLSRSFGGHVRGEGRRRLVAPVEGQMVSASEGARDLGNLRLREEAEHWPEGWAAWCYGGEWAAGFLWGKVERVECGSWGCRNQTSLGTLAPGEAMACEPFYVYVGEGDAAAVRRWWRLLFAPETKVEDKPRKSEAVRLSVEPHPLVIGAKRDACLKLSAVGKKALKGDVALTMPAGFSPRRIEGKGRDFGDGREFVKPFTLIRQASAREGVYQAELALDDGDHIYRRPVHVIALGSAKGTVRVAKTKGGLYQIANGALALTVAPGFGGCAVALEQDGVNHLRTSYPTAGPMAWWNPWHGGICPSLEEPRERLHKHKCRAEVCQRPGVSGAVWRGVRLTWDRKKEDLGGFFRYQIEYLLAPGSRIAAVAVRCQNRAVLPTRYHAGIEVWPNTGGSHLDAVLHGALDPQASRKRTDIGGGIHGGPWVTAENPKTGRAMILIAGDDNPVCGASVIGQDGYHLEAQASRRLEPGESEERIYYIVLADSATEARAYAPLSSARDLL